MLPLEGTVRWWGSWGWYPAKQVGYPGIVLPLLPEGIVKLELHCGVMSELGPGVLTPTWVTKEVDLNHIPGP